MDGTFYIILQKHRIKSFCTIFEMKTNLFKNNYLENVIYDGK